MLLLFIFLKKHYKAGNKEWKTRILYAYLTKKTPPIPGALLSCVRLKYSASSFPLSNDV